MPTITWSNCVNQEAATITCLEPLLKNVISALLSLAGFALFVMLLIGGFNFLFAAGDQKKLEKAKGTITAAFIGLIVMVVAYLIIKTIEVFTGVPLTTFNIVMPN